jgi:hypothetical protein
MRVIGACVIAVGVSAASMFISFVVMVNIWEQIGLAH